MGSGPCLLVMTMNDSFSAGRSDDEAEAIIHWACARAGVIVITPLMGGSFLVANEVYMIAKLGELYGQDLTTSTIAGFVAGMAGLVGGQLLAGIIPIPGFSTVVAVGTTYAIGQAARAWIKDGTPSDLRRYKDVAAEAKKRGERLVDQFKKDPRRHQPLGDESKKF